MKLKFLKSVNGSPDGIKILSYIKDEIHDVAESLCDIFLKEGFAVQIAEEIKEKVKEKIEKIVEKEEKKIETPVNKAVDSEKISNKRTKDA